MAAGADQPARVWLALDCASQRDAALHVAAALAHGSGAELACVFVEDVDLLRLAGLPLAAETSLLSARSRPLAAGDLERQLRGQAAGIEADVAKLARGAGVAWSFQVRRGKPLAEALNLATHAGPLVIPGRALAPRVAPRRANPAIRATATRGTGARPAGGSLLLLLDGTPDTAALLQLAGRLALNQHAMLEIVVTDAAHLDRAQLQALETPGLRVVIHRQAAPQPARIAAQARLSDVRLVLSSRAVLPLEEAVLHALMLELSCPLVLA